MCSGIPARIPAVLSDCSEDVIEVSIHLHCLLRQSVYLLGQRGVMSGCFVILVLLRTEVLPEMTRRLSYLLIHLHSRLANDPILRKLIRRNFSASTAWTWLLQRLSLIACSNSGAFPYSMGWWCFGSFLLCLPFSWLLGSGFSSSTP